MKHLNRDQLDGLAKLCFDLAKAALLVAFFPSISNPTNPASELPKIISGFLVGLAFTYTALIILRVKGRS